MAIAANIQLHSHRAVLEWSDASTLQMPFLWLRDNCPCDDCRVTQTTEKKFILSDVPRDLAPAEMSLTEAQLDITWPDGHQTCYPLEMLQAFSQRHQKKWQPWPDDYQPRYFDFNESLASDVVARDMIEELANFGAVVLTETPAEEQSLETLASRLGPVREMPFARLHEVIFDPDGYNVAATALQLPPHNDFASASWPPSIQALHMLANQASGGESIIVDTFSLIEKYRVDHPEFFEALCNTPIPFRMFSDDVETYTTQPMVRCDADGNVVHVRFSNQLMQVADPGATGMETFYFAYHELCRRITDPAAKVTFRLEGGQILVVASHRVLHAREAFEPDGERHLRDAYYELENAINHIKVIDRKSEEQG